MDIFPADFNGNFRLDSSFIADEAENGIRRVFRELADELELDQVCVLVSRVLSIMIGMRAYAKATRDSGNNPGRHCDGLYNKA